MQEGGFEEVSLSLNFVHVQALFERCCGAQCLSDLLEMVSAAQVKGLHSYSRLMKYLAGASPGKCLYLRKASSERTWSS
jgi:hypothetical protein